MERSSIFKHFATEALQHGIEQGAREHALKDILEVFELRLKPYAATSTCFFGLRVIISQKSCNSDSHLV